MLSTAVEPSALSLAFERGIEAFEIADVRDPSIAHLLELLHAEVACVACWPRRIPASVLARFPLGVLNLHPSLLPVHRGPVPLFWTLRHGDVRAGITVHLMDDTVDSGPILAQRQVEMEDGTSGLELETRCAVVGGELLARCVLDLAGERLRPRPQEPGAGSYEPWPQASDFVVSNASSARWAYNFIRGAAYWGGPIVIDCAGTRFTVREALGYARDEDCEEVWRRQGDELLVRCRPGVLRVLIEAP
jgi:methionyl-tRNA formyltransferase